MIRYVFIAALAVPALAFAQPASQDKLQRCTLIAGALNVAASARDAQVSPQEALHWAKGAVGDKLDDATLKKAVNSAYFDPRFALANTSEFVDQFTLACAHPQQWQPLK